jgi:uncharacterized alpha-E superfamily protein
MLSRVADSLYWMSRYMERSDGIIRKLKVDYAFSQESVAEKTFDNKADLQNMIANKENHNSLVHLITKARENARSGQDHISKELWQCLNEFYHYIKVESLDDSLRKKDPATVLENLTKNCVLYYGTADMTMVRGEGYFFINIGKYLERSLQVADLLALQFHEHGPEDLAEAKAIIEEQVLNGNFPRSVIYSISRLYRYFERLRSEKNIEAYNKLNFMIGELNSRVRYSTSDSIMRQGLDGYLLRIREDLYNIANALNQCYFAYSL